MKEEVKLRISKTLTGHKRSAREVKIIGKRAKEIQLWKAGNNKWRGQKHSEEARRIIKLKRAEQTIRERNNRIPTLAFCTVCGTIRRVEPSRLQKINNFYCSVKCMGFNMKGKDPYNKGKLLNENTKKKISINSKLMWKNPEIAQKIRQARINQIYPKKDTKPEKMVQLALLLNNIKFEKHKPIIFGKRNYQIDIFVEPNICILIHGCYWHYCPNCFKGKVPKIAQSKNMIRDQKQYRILIENGYSIIILWEHWIKTNSSRLSEGLIKILKQKIAQ